MTQDSPQHDSDHVELPDTLPQAVLDALRACDGPVPLAGEDYDQAILAGAREHLSAVRQRRRSRWVLTWALTGGGSVAAAAAVAVAFWIGMDHNGSSPMGDPMAASENAVPLGTPPPRPATPGDLDHSGAIDILDAFALARQLESGDAPAVTLADMTGDGRVDDLDVEYLASLAVALHSDGGAG